MLLLLYLLRSLHTWIFLEENRLRISKLNLANTVWMFIQGEHDRGNVVGLSQHTGEPIDPQMEGIFDNYSVKRQIINSGSVRTQYLINNIVLFCLHF